MKKRIFIIALILFVVLGIYLNRSYAHIYDKIDAMNLLSSDKPHSYTIGSVFSKSITYVALGDSLTSGVGIDTYVQSYPYQLAQKLSEKNKQKIILKPQAIPGAKTGDAITQLLDQTIKLNPDLVTVLLGVNDVHGRISKEEFQTNYEIILNRLTQETKAKIYLVAIPYIGTADLILPPYTLYFDSRIQEFNEVIKLLAKENNLLYIDLYTPNLQFQGKEYYSSDLFHPSFAGYTKWAQILYDGFTQ